VRQHLGSQRQQRPAITRVCSSVKAKLLACQSATPTSPLLPQIQAQVCNRPRDHIGVLVWRSMNIDEICDATSRSWFLTKAYNAANSRVCIRKATSHQTDRRDGMADRMAGKKMRWRCGVKQYRSKICLLHTKYAHTKTQHQIKIKSDCLVNSSDQTGLTSPVPAAKRACLS
jgi:hypothetical protein